MIKFNNAAIASATAILRDYLKRSGKFFRIKKSCKIGANETHADRF